MNSTIKGALLQCDMLFACKVLIRSSISVMTVRVLYTFYYMINYYNTKVLLGGKVKMASIPLRIILFKLDFSSSFARVCSI